MSSDFKSGPVLVTGAAGQVGFDLLQELSEFAAVIGVTRHELDLENPDSIRSVIRRWRPSLVINAAAYTAVDGAESDTDRCGAVNAVAPEILAQELARVGGALIHYSTDYVFDGDKCEPYTETDQPNPRNVYGATKLAGERAVAASGVAHLIFRTSWVYATRGKNFLHTMLRLAREQSELRVVADQIGAPTWSRAIAVATHQVVEQLGDVRSLEAKGGIYNMTAGGATSWFGFANAILQGDPRRAEQRAERVVPVAAAEYRTPARRPANSRLNGEKLERVFGVVLAPWEHALSSALSELPG